MVVRIILREGPKLRSKPAKNQRIAARLGVFLPPSACLAFAFGVWRTASGLGFAGPFVIADGFFSHWVSWMGLAAVLQLTAMTLSRIGDREERSLSVR